MFLFAFVPDSEAISVIVYDSDLEELDLYFTTGRAYQYHEVPLGVVASMLASESIGRYYNVYIKDAYDSHRIYSTHKEAL
jgi:hypothetical protein